MGEELEKDGRWGLLCPPLLGEEKQLCTFGHYQGQKEQCWGERLWR